MNAHLVPSGAAGATEAGRRALLAGLIAVALPVALLLLAGVAGGAVQHRPLWSLEPLKPKLSRLSPLAGAKRVLGREALIQFTKGLLKIGIVGAIAGAVLWNERERLDAFARLDPAALLPWRSATRCTSASAG